MENSLELIELSGINKAEFRFTRSIRDSSDWISRKNSLTDRAIQYE
jgi:hypothetical protein